MVGTGRHFRRRGARGASLIEVTVAITILAIVGVGTSATLASSSTSNARNREAALAQEAVQGVLDELRALPRQEIFFRYNADPTDDPADGASPGPAFPVPGLQPTDVDPDGFVGRIEFPGDGSQLLENVDQRELGMPRDLNGNDELDEFDVKHDYTILPVRISVTYQGRGGPRTISYVTQL